MLTLPLYSACVKIVILQPSYLPWLGYLDQYAWCDRFVLYDDVQYDKHGWRNRNRVLCQGKPQWLTIPVLGRDFPLLSEVQVDLGQPWRRKHLASLEQLYARAPHAPWLLPKLRDYYANTWNHLIDWDIEGLRWMCELLGLPWKLVRSSELGVPRFQRGPVGDRAPESSSERLCQICSRLGGTRYLTGDAARDYLQADQFQEVGIEVVWHGYDHPTYRQGKGQAPFVSHLSVVDLLFWHGPESLSILWQTRK